MSIAFQLTMVATKFRRVLTLEALEWEQEQQSTKAVRICRLSRMNLEHRRIHTDGRLSICRLMEAMRMAIFPGSYAAHQTTLKKRSLSFKLRSRRPTVRHALVSWCFQIRKFTGR